MAKWAGSAIVSTASGAAGGIVFRSGRGGNVLAGRGRRKVQDTDAQGARAEAMAKACAFWRILTDDEKRAWNNAAGQRVYADSLGTKRNLSGYSLFMKEALAFFGVPYASTHYPPAFETPAITGASYTFNLGFLLLTPTIIADPGVNIAWMVSGVRYGSYVIPAQPRRYRFVHSEIESYGGTINIAGSEWPCKQDYASGEKFLVRFYGIALDHWASGYYDLEVEVP